MKTFTTRASALAIMTLAATALAGTAFAQTGGSMAGPSTPAGTGTMSGGSMASPATPAGSNQNTMSGGSMQGQNTKGTTPNKKKPAATGAMATPGQSSGTMGSQGSMATPPH